MSFFEELKRRNVFRVGIAYLVGAWLLLQLADVLSELLNLPEQMGPVVVAIVALGFPIVLFAAWAYELTPQGIKRESEVDRSQSVAGRTGRNLNVLITVLLLVAVGYLLYDKFLLREAADSGETGIAATEPAEEPPPAPTPPVAEPAPTPVSRQSIAVLPFDNRSRLEEDEFFVEGVHDDLLTTLARIGGLKVISRTSVSQYADTGKTIPQIASELGVATVMEGAVQRSGDMVRINVQLIDATTDEHLWAEIFDRELTAENLFAIQSEISEEIAAALEATLTPDEQRRINDRPTENLAAYSAYLRGRQLQERRNTVQLEEAMAEFRRAVELDPDFAQAWVGIAETATLLTTWGTLPAEERNRIRTDAANRAMELAPELGEAWLVYAQVANTREQAEERYRRAIELSPSYVTAYQWYANDIQDDFRRLEESQQLLEQAVALDPLSPILRDQAAWNLLQMGRVEVAERRLRALLEDDPEFVPALLHLGAARNFQGDLVEAAQLFRKAASLDPGNPGPLTALMASYHLLGYRDGLSELRERLVAMSPDMPLIGMMDSTLALVDGRSEAALEHLGWVEQRVGQAPWLGWEKLLIHTMNGDFESARTALEFAAPRVVDPDAWTELPDGRQRYLEQLCIGGYIMARNGAAKAGEARISAGLDYALNELPRYLDPRVAIPTTGLCLLAAGEVEPVIELLKGTTDSGNLSWVRIFQINRGPLFEPVRTDPRFQELLGTAETELVRQREELARLDAGRAGP